DGLRCGRPGSADPGAPDGECGPDRSQRLRPGHRAPREDIRALLHDEAERNGNGIGDLPLDRRVSRRPLVGGDQQASGGEVHLHVAGSGESGAMTTEDHLVFIVDDDPRIREALSELLESHGIRTVAYGSAGEYVRADKPDVPASLI